MSYVGIGIMETILDYKFFADLGAEIAEYKNFEELKLIVREEYRKQGINVISDVRDGNKYYRGVKKINRNELIRLINLKSGSTLRAENYFA